MLVSPTGASDCESSGGGDRVDHVLRHTHVHALVFLVGDVVYS
jgi:hypothetical protein